MSYKYVTVHACTHSRTHPPPSPPPQHTQLTEGPNAGKLALIDFGLVAEIPPKDREAMVSATIHLANRDWDALVEDFISLGFLPRDCDRCARVCGVWVVVVRMCVAFLQGCCDVSNDLACLPIPVQPRSRRGVGTCACTPPYL